jgi:hypothetical protein
MAFCIVRRLFRFVGARQFLCDESNAAGSARALERQRDGALRHAARAISRVFVVVGQEKATRRTRQANIEYIVIVCRGDMCLLFVHSSVAVSCRARFERFLVESSARFVDKVLTDEPENQPRNEYPILYIWSVGATTKISRFSSTRSSRTMRTTNGGSSSRSRMRRNDRRHRRHRRCPNCWC